MKHLKKLCAGIAGTMGAGSAFATAPDYSSLTAAVDWSSVSTSLLAVGVAIIGVMVVFKGIKLITRAVKGA